ncbi:MAG: GNAT family N-acetyltransferase [Zoogloeaceae bacterium]|jgi:GNAT superfamily N-acetyltransferase|nr:GNAT family N-acetyltransferase [Zoogloeaceae bacterium]
MSSLSLPITPATLADVPALIELLGILFAIEQDFHPDAEKQRRGLEMLLARPEHACILTARHPAAGVVGMVSAQLVISTAGGAPSAWIEDVVIRPEFRACGLGGQLLKAARDWAITQGATRLQLLADADNTPALEFYKHLDWQPTRLFAWRQGSKPGI